MKKAMKVHQQNLSFDFLGVWQLLQAVGAQSSGLIIFTKVAGLGNPKKVEFHAGGNYDTIEFEKYTPAPSGIAEEIISKNG